MFDLFFTPVLGFIQFLPLIAAGISAAGSLIAGNQAKKAAQGAANASQVDIDALDAKTREIARKNALDAAELERQLTPEVPALRSAANQAVLSGLNPTANEVSAENDILSGLAGSPGSSLQTPLLRAAIAKAKADLELGGKLPVDVQNLITRQGLATTGSSMGNLGLGRDVVARDLGLTGLQIEQQRLDNAARLGGQEMGMESENNNVAFNNAAHHINLLQLLQSISGNRFNRGLAAAQLGQAIPQPIVGLDPGSVADVTTGNATNRSAALTSQANIYGAQQQGLTNFAGQLLGYGLLNQNKPVTTTAPITRPVTNPYPLVTSGNPFLSGATYTFGR